MRVDNKIAAREWILSAIQNHVCIPNKETKREIEKFVRRLQRDINQMRKSREKLLRELINAQERDDRNNRFDHAINK